MSNNHLNFAKKLKDDEYYTRRFLVETIFKKTVEVFGKNNTLYVLAADNDHSFFTRYAKLNQLNYVNNIDIYQLPNFIFTKPIFPRVWTTVVITNPPFSLLVDWLKKIQRNVEYDGLQLCLIIPIATISTASLRWYLQHCYFHPFNAKMNTFFNNMELKSVNTMLMTTFKINDWPVHPKQPTAPTEPTISTPVTRIIYKQYYESLGYQLVGVDPTRQAGLFKRLLWEKKQNDN